MLAVLISSRKVPKMTFLQFPPLAGCIHISPEAFSCVTLSDLDCLFILALKVGNIPKDYYQCWPNYYPAAFSRVCAS